MQLMEGVDQWRTVDGVSVLRVHYTADPKKRDPQWQQEARMATTTQDWAMEMEIDFSTVKGVAWYPEFNPEIHVARTPLQPIPNRAIITGFDYGLTPATIFVQTTPNGQIMVHYPELQSWESGMVKHANLVKQAMATYFPGYTFTHYGDPAGNQRAQTNERTCVQLLREDYGIIVRNGPVVFNQRDMPIRKALSTLVEGKPQLVIDPRNKWLIEALKGGYQRMEVNGEVLDKLNDNKYTHIVDALGYAVSMIQYQGEVPLKGKMPKLGEM